MLDDVDPNSGILREKIFGPGAPSVAFGGFDDAVRFGEHDGAKGLACAAEIEAGMIGLN